MTGVRMLGLLHDTVVFLVEQLQGARRCHSHTFRFFKQISQEEDLPVNPSGCARSEVYLRKSTFDMFNFLASQHRQLPDINHYDEEEDEVPLKSTRRATSLDLPMAMHFRYLERTSKEAVGVYRVSAATCSVSMTLTWWTPRSQQCGALHQPLVRAQLLLTRHLRGGPEAHRHLCPVQDLPGQGGYCHDCPVRITMGQISLAMVDNNQTFSHPLKRGGGSPVVNVSRLSLPLQYLTQVMIFVNFSPRNSNTV
ncbi:uncharacterized protein LOC115113948 [Oncorhynchus nerka]|uniref:uncharacterized protein LOC115113948 n=1 Tax=Oncorhynchus nerka TaxID=8023 RepID=UPI0031B82FD3